MSYVLLQCVKEGSNLKVKMMSSYPFIKGNNCQFPRSIRVNGMYYVVESKNITLQSSSGKKSFYSMRKEENIVLSTMNFIEVQQFLQGLPSETVINHCKVYGDDDDNECVVCFSDVKTVVFIPCGHYVCCGSCSKQCNTCPICRSKINMIANRSDIS